MAKKLVTKHSLIKGIEIHELRDGVPSFLGVPVAKRKEDLEKADAAIIGIPFERGSYPGRPGEAWSGFQSDENASYSKAPTYMRQFSLRYGGGGYLPEYDLDVFDHVKLVDYGDAEITEDDIEGSVENVNRKVQEVIAAGCRPITIGAFSPCATYAVIKGISKQTSGLIGTISLDAHGDCHETEFGPEGSREPGSVTWESCMWNDFPNVDPTHHAEIGNRGPDNTREQFQIYRDRGAHFYPSPTVRQMGVNALCLKALPHVFRGTERTWLQIDMDVLDISAVPDWGDEPLGLSAWDVVKIIHEAAKAGLFSLSYVYVAPTYSIGSLVSYLTVYLLAGWIQGGHIKKG